MSEEEYLKQRMFELTQQRDGAINRFEAADAQAEAMREARNRAEELSRTYAGLLLKAEAQAAAMRDVLEKCTFWATVYSNTLKSMSTNPKGIDGYTTLEPRVKAALSTDAGAALLKVVEAAKAYHHADSVLNDIPNDLVDHPIYDRAKRKLQETGDALCESVDALAALDSSYLTSKR